MESYCIYRASQYLQIHFCGRQLFHDLQQLRHNEVIIR